MSTGYVDDARLAVATKMLVEDVRDWLETLEGKGFAERTRLTDGFSAYVTAKGKQAIRMTEPIANPKPGTAVAGSGRPSLLSPGSRPVDQLITMSLTSRASRRILRDYIFLSSHFSGLRLSAIFSSPLGKSKSRT